MSEFDSHTAENSESSTRNTFTSRRSLLRAGGASVALSVGLAGCTGGFQSAAGSGGGTLTIGINGTRSGFLSGLGSFYHYGYKAWEKQLKNQDGTINGINVEMVYADNESKESRSSQIASRFAGEEDVDFMITAVGTSLTAAAAPTSNKNEIPHLSTGSTTPPLHAKYEYMFEGMPQYKHDNEAAMLQGRVKKAAALAVDVDFAVLQLEHVKNFFPEHGIEVVQSATHPLDQSDFSSFLQKSKQKGVEAVISMNYSSHMIPMMRQMQSMGYSPKYVSNSTATAGNLPNKLGSELINGLTAPLLWNPSIQTDSSDKFISLMKDVSPEEITPTYHSCLAYSGLQMLEEAIGELGSEATDGPTLRDWFAENASKTAIGTCEFDDRGVQTGIYQKVAQWHPNDLLYVYPVDVKQDDLIFPKPWP